MPNQVRPSASSRSRLPSGARPFSTKARGAARQGPVDELARQAGAGVCDTRARLPQQLERALVADLDAGLGEHPAGRVVHRAAGRVVPDPQLGARPVARRRVARRRATCRRVGLPARDPPARPCRSRLALLAGGLHDRVDAGLHRGIEPEGARRRAARRPAP